MRRRVSLYTIIMALVILIGVVFIRVPKAAEVGGGTGKIGGKLFYYPKANLRQYNNGQAISVSYRSLVSYANVNIKLLNAATETEIANMNTGAAGEYEFTNIPNGEYYVEVAETDNNNVENEILPKVGGEKGITYPKSWDVDIPFQTSRRSEKITIDDTKKENTDIYFASIFRPYAVKLKTNIGKFSYTLGNVEKSEPELPLYNGGIATGTYGNETFMAIRGVLATDRLSDSISVLPKPDLSPEEIAYGYSFLGWMLDEEMFTKYPEYRGYADSIFKEENILGIVAKGDIVLKAMYTYPIHQVKFASDSSKGLITAGNQSSAYVTVNINGNTTRLTEATIPTVSAKPGYRFVGWYEDMTTNVVPLDEIYNRTIRDDKVYYAKYEAVEQEVSARTTVNPIQERDTKISGKGIAASEIGLTLPSGTKIVTQADGNGTWSTDINEELAAGQVISVTQTEANKLESLPLDITVIRTVPETTPNPVVGTVREGDLAITGKGKAGATIQVTFKNSMSAFTEVSGDGTWSVPVIEGINIEYGDNVFVTQTENGKLTSSSTDATAIEKTDANSNNNNNANVSENKITETNLPNVSNTSGGGSSNVVRSSGGGNVIPRVVTNNTVNTKIEVAPATPTPAPVAPTPAPATPAPAPVTPAPSETTPIVLKIEEPIKATEDISVSTVAPVVPKKVIINKVPKTDDKNNMILWILLLLVSFGLSILSIKKNK